MHEGHRQRMKEKFLNGNEKAFAPHELLEMLLFYAIPRCNTNEIAHELLDKFGSLRNVMEADYDDLKSVKGIGEHAAFLIKFIPGFLKIYSQEAGKDIHRFDKISVAREFGISMLLGYPEENVFALLLNNQLRKIGFINLNQGFINSVSINLASLYSNCFSKKVSAVILYHNHPSGLATPSREDIDLTYLLESKLADVNIYLLEHFVISDYACTPILMRQKDGLRLACSRFGISSKKVENFYLS